MASTPTGAVFLSYASQDTAAAQRICEALRAADIEVWFDQSELRGGDAWDQMIRRQIKACALFIPVISRHTHERREGYFRLEWKLAVDRSNLISATQAFLIPVVIDNTREDDEEVPEKLRDVHWTRLPGGETPAAFVERIRRLLSGQTAPVPDGARTSGSAVAWSAPARRSPAGWRTGVVYASIAAAVLVALGSFGIERLNRSKPGGPGAASIAVLPLTNESGEASQQYFSDGISEDLITALSQFPGLKVIGRTSSFQFRDSKEDGRSIGEKLGVAHLLEGSVRKSGDMIRVSAELIDTADGSTQWSERYDRPYKDLFALQDEITRAVAGALRTKLLLGEHAEAQSDRPPSGSLEAYSALLQGRFYHFLDTEAELRKAIEYYTQATQLDPRYALAWSWLSKTLTDLGDSYITDINGRRDAFAKGREAADRALALAPELAAAHGARGWSLQADFDWRGAEAEYRRAVALSPDDSDAKVDLSDLLVELGEIEPAIELTRQALATEPLRAGLYLRLANRHAALNRLDEAERDIRRAIELQPGATAYHATLTWIEVQRGNAQAALAAAQQEPSGPYQEIAVAFARQIGSDQSAADAALKTIIEKYGNVFPSTIADFYALRNDAKGTFEWLDKAFSTRDPGVGGLLYDPFILRYRDDPRFAAFCRQIGLPAPGDARQQT